MDGDPRRVFRGHHQLRQLVRIGASRRRCIRSPQHGVGLLNNYPHFDVYGYYPQGGYVHQYTSLVYTYTTLQTLTFGNGFKGVNKLVFSSVYAQVDNINLSTASVPEPETYAMLLAGLGLVGFAARRQTSSANRFPGALS